MNTDPPNSSLSEASIKAMKVSAPSVEECTVRLQALALTLFVVPVVFMLAPGLTALDAGELLAASTELGVAHPPGLVIFCLFHKFITLLVPFGDIAFRGNLASGLLGGLTAVWVARVAMELKVRPYLAALGAPLLLISPVFVLHSVTVEVYSGVVWLSLLALEFALAGRRSQDRRYWAISAFVLGASIGGHHGELRIVALLIMGTVLLSDRRIRFWSVYAVSGMAGFLVTLYLPVRANTQPWRNWGDPSTLESWLAHFWADRIRAAYSDQMGSVDAVVNAEFIDQMVFMQWPLAVLGSIGMALALRHSWGWMVGAIGIIDLLYSLFLNPMGVRDMQNGMLLTGALGVGVVVCLNEMWTLAHRIFPNRQRLKVVVGIAVLAWMITLGIPRAELSDDRSLTELLWTAEDHLAPETLMLTASDDFSAGWAFRQVVEGSRPDIAVVVRQHVGYPSSVEPVKRRLPHTLLGWTPGASLHSLKHLRSANVREEIWPIAWEWAGGIDGTYRPNGLRPRFPVYVSDGQLHRDSGRAYFAHLQRWLEPDNPTNVRLASQLAADLSQYLTITGTLLTGTLEHAIEAALWATELSPDSSPHWVQLGVACSRLSGALRQKCRGQSQATVGNASCENEWKELMERAVIATEMALELEATNGTARTNLVRYLVNLERHEAALAELNTHGKSLSRGDELAFRGLIAANEGNILQAKNDCFEALLNEPKQDDAQNLLLQIAQRERAQGHLSDAEQTIERLIETSGDNATLRIELGVLALQKNEDESAYRAFSQALRLEPYSPKANLIMASLRVRALCFMDAFPPKTTAP